MESGYYTTDNSDLYFKVSIKSQNDESIEAEVSLYYKKGEYKDHEIETNENYKIMKKNITHWKRYSLEDQ